MTLAAHDVTVRVGDRLLNDAVSLSADRGEFVGLIGPNGSGKTTLLKTMYRALVPTAGVVTLDADDIHRMRPRDVARRLAVVPQESSLEFDYSVWEMAMLGRIPHKTRFSGDNRHDIDVVSGALERVGALGLAGQDFQRLSGGEKQRVLVARALAQEAEYLILDEPTNHLDVRYQFEILDLLRELDVGVLAALHDLNLAARYCDRLYMLDNGRICAAGSPTEVLNPAIIRSAFAVDIETTRAPLSGLAQVFFVRQATEGSVPTTTRPKEASDA